jgi:hypothetical protein
MRGIRKIQSGLALMAAMLLPQSVFAMQELAVENLEGCIIGEDCTPESIAETPLSTEHVTVAFADSVGEDSAAVEDMLAGNPNVRISPLKEQADYLIARYPDFPATLVLIRNQELFNYDDLGARHYDGSDQRIARMYQRFASERYVRADYLPLVLGSLDDASLASELNGELQQILQARRLLAFRGKENPTLNFTTIVKECPATDQSGNCETVITHEIRNRLSTPQYVALVPIDQYSLRFKATSENPVTPFVLDPNAARILSELPSGLHVAIVSSDQPLDMALLARSGGQADEIPRSWNVGVFSTPVRKSYRGGGGRAVTALFAAPWQVQLYSTDSNTPASLRASAALGKVAWAQHEKTHRCGGSVIGQDGNQYIVLTAAHCIANQPFAGPVKRQDALKFRRVKLGTLNLRYGGTTYAIDSIVVHRDYVEGGNSNDIALLRIKPDSSTLVQNTKSVRLITPASRPISPGARVKWYGWGFMEETEGHVARMTSNNVVQRNPAQLHEGEMQLLERKKCNMRAGYGKVTDFMLCAVTPSDSDAARRGEHVFTCQGDSGGPITGIENGKTVQVGIVSWAVGCGAKDNPSVSVNVAKYQTWIGIAKTKFVSGKSVEQ